MKKYILLITLSILSVSKSYSTIQRPDILIIEGDTIHLRWHFILEMLQPPFVSPESFESTACWRGYLATWIVLDNKLYLKDIVKDNNRDEKIDLSSHFKKYGYTPRIENGMILADWYTGGFNVKSEKFRKHKYYYDESSSPKKRKIIFDKGILIFNNLKKKKKKK